MNSSGKLYKMYGAEWAEFVKDSRYTNVDVLHFILQEEDTYYVTAYDDGVSECGGYNHSEIGRRQMRCFVTMGAIIEHSPVSVYDMNFFYTLLLNLVYVCSTC